MLRKSNVGGRRIQRRLGHTIDFTHPVIASNFGPKVDASIMPDQKYGFAAILKSVTICPWKTSTPFWERKTVSALFVGIQRQADVDDLAWITTMIQARFVDFYAQDATPDSAGSRTTLRE